MVSPPPTLIVHGGAGRGRSRADERIDADLRRELVRAIDAGWQQISAGAEAACVAAVRVLEDSPLFNAATGSALAADGSVWCDASLVCGDGRAGAVAAVQGIRHPVSAAQALARTAQAPLLWAGRSSDLVALHDLEQIEPELMVTERQRRRLQRHLAGELEHGPGATGGTVGAVCLDAAGGLAAATSTGGYAAKPPARIGDSAIVGAGTWADARTCAVSATGDGEAFMRVLFAHEIHARMLYAGESLAAAAGAAVAAVGDAGGSGGAICVAADGAIAMPVSSEVMARAWRRADERTRTALGGAEAASLNRVRTRRAR